MYIYTQYRLLYTLYSTCVCVHVVYLCMYVHSCLFFSPVGAAAAQAETAVVALAAEAHSP